MEGGGGSMLRRALCRKDIKRRFCANVRGREGVHARESESFDAGTFVGGCSRGRGHGYSRSTGSRGWGAGCPGRRQVSTHLETSNGGTVAFAGNEEVAIA